MYVAFSGVCFSTKQFYYKKFVVQPRHPVIPVYPSKTALFLYPARSTTARRVRRFDGVDAGEF